MRKRTAVIGIIAGIAAIIATIFIIKKGPELKKDLLEKVDKMKTKIKDIEMSDVKAAISEKLTEIKKSIQEFDWNKSKREVEAKFHEVKKQLQNVKKHIPLTEVDENQ